MKNLPLPPARPLLGRTRPNRDTRLALRSWMLGLTASALLPFTLPAAQLNLTTATIPELQAAFASGLTSEKITSAYLARIAAYDQQGPKINSVITLNPQALAEAQALDAERKAGKVRGPLHGIPIVLKDNIDTFDLPTTGGSQLLEGSIAPDDAFIVKKLRAAGAVIVAKVNLSEFAGSGGSVHGSTSLADLAAGAVPNGSSTAGGQTRNPHDLTRGPAGSSGGTGAALAAGFAQMGLGTDTGGSIRGPSSANGIVGLKPTLGLLSRDGIIPLALSLDTGGPMARTVTDVAISLGIMTGVDKADPATRASKKHLQRDYTPYLKRGALKGARIGVARDFFGKDPEVDRIMAAALATLKAQGAIIIDPVKYPEPILAAQVPLYASLVNSEFKAQITDYLKTTAPKYPKSFDELLARVLDPATRYRSPEKAYSLKYTGEKALALTDPEYLALKQALLPAVKTTLEALFRKHQLDAIVYPTSPRPALLITPTSAPQPASGTDSPRSFANFSGFPDLVVPAGMTKDGLPVTISFFGPAWSEPQLLGYGYDFEQASRAHVWPKTTPPLPSDLITY